MVTSPALLLLLLAMPVSDGAPFATNTEGKEGSSNEWPVGGRREDNNVPEMYDDEFASHNYTMPDYEYDGTLEHVLGEFCYEQFVECWNRTDLKILTEQFTSEEWFDPYKINKTTKEAFCSSVAPSVEKCIIDNFLEAGIEEYVHDVASMLDICTNLVVENPIFTQDEVDEMDHFHRSYRYLCGRSAPPDECFELKQRSCVLEKARIDCNVTCPITAERDQSSNTPSPSSGKIALVILAVGVSLGALIE